MGLKDLFDEPEIKVEKTDYEKGKNYCCDEVCANIKDGIESFTDAIDAVLLGNTIEDITDERKLKYIEEYKISIKTLRGLGRSIASREPHCKCR